jgi:hypothetical protein
LRGEKAKEGKAHDQAACLRSIASITALTLDWTQRLSRSPMMPAWQRQLAFRPKSSVADGKDQFEVERVLHG